MDLLIPKNINKDRVLKYVQGENNPEKILAIIDEVLPKVLEVSKPKVTTFSCDYIPDELILGEDIKKHLSGCCGVLLFAVTLGTEVDKLIRKMQYENVFKQVICDAVSSVLIEEISEKFEEDIKKEYLLNELYLTSSYASGYGDYPLSVLQYQLNILDAHRKIGVALTSSGLMTPRKSICAVLGVAKTPVKGFRAGCEHCVKNSNCKLRKEGKTCVR